MKFQFNIPFCSQFLIIFRKANAGELEGDSGLGQLARLTEVDVGEIGVQGAKTFFEAKVRFCLCTWMIFIQRNYCCHRLRTIATQVNLRTKFARNRKIKDEKKKTKLRDMPSLNRKLLFLLNNLKNSLWWL